MNNVVIWSKTTCAYCSKAKRLFKEHNTDYEERLIGDGWGREDLLSVIPADRVPERLTVPQIFIDGAYIGGYEDLQKHIGVDNIAAA